MNHHPNAALGIAALVIGALIVAMLPSKKPAPPPAEAFEVPVPLQEWTTDAGAMVSRAVVAGLKTHPGQKTVDCDPDLGEQLRNGACWMKTDVPPPCPKGKLQEDEGKCWRPVPKASRSPTSGEPRPRGVAEP